MPAFTKKKKHHKEKKKLREVSVNHARGLRTHKNPRLTGTDDQGGTSHQRRSEAHPPGNSHGDIDDRGAPPYQGPAGSRTLGSLPGLAGIHSQGGTSDGGGSDSRTPGNDRGPTSTEDQGATPHQGPSGTRTQSNTSGSAGIHNRGGASHGGVSGPRTPGKDRGSAGSHDRGATPYRSYSGTHIPINDTGLAGIDAQGATCYLNSLLQTLAHTPELRESLLQLRPKELFDDKNRPIDKKRNILIEVLLLFARLLYMQYQHSYSSVNLTTSLGWDDRQTHVQHDVQELYRSLLGTLENSLEGTSKEKAISDLYHGSVINEITCQKCYKVNRREEDFLDLTLPITGMANVSESLRAMYQSKEFMSGSDQYWCNDCKRSVNAEKCTKVKKLPPILALSLLRFRYNFWSHQRSKDTSRYKFPLEIDMEPYCDQRPLSSGRGDDSVYELFSVIIHSGSTHSGHYHAYIKDVEGNGNWTPPEKTFVYQEDETYRPIIKAILPPNNDPMSIAKLRKVSKKESWYDQFRKKCGDVTQFLRRNSDLFVVDSARDTVSSKIPSGHWFDFNDSRVQPIHEDVIRYQDEGRESAYMLFYRRKDMLRTSTENKQKQVLPEWLSRSLPPDEDNKASYQPPMTFTEKNDRSSPVEQKIREQPDQQMRIKEDIIARPQEQFQQLDPVRNRTREENSALRQSELKSAQDFEASNEVHQETKHASEERERELEQEMTIQRDQHQQQMEIQHVRIAELQERIEQLDQELKHTKEANSALRQSKFESVQDSEALKEVHQQTKQASEKREKELEQEMTIQRDQYQQQMEIQHVRIAELQERIEQLNQELNRTREENSALRQSELKKTRDSEALKKVHQETKQAPEEQEKPRSLMTTNALNLESTPMRDKLQHQMRVKEDEIARLQKRIQELSRELKQTRRTLAKTNSDLQRSEQMRAQESEALQRFLQQTNQALGGEEETGNSTFARRQGNPRREREKGESNSSQNQSNRGSHVGTMNQSRHTSQREGKVGPEMRSRLGTAWWC